MKVQVLYDFEGQPGSSELTIKAGEMLTVTRQDIGEGWWEGTDQRGNTGLFPAAYVDSSASNSNQKGSADYDYWDEEWDDDSDGANGTPSIPDTNFNKPTLHSLISTDDSQNTGRVSNAKRPSIKAMPVVNKQTYTKSGSDSYIMGILQLNVPDNEKIYIINNEYGIIWSPLTDLYTCNVASPKKESKLKGFKSFIVYQLTPSFNNIQVSRRYKHFDWLHERLVEKYSFIPIPPLPDKQIAGRYEEHFIERRKNQLQTFVDYVCRHPVLSQSKVWQHFLTCTDEKRWKLGKRKAENDKLVAANFFFSVIAPEPPLGSFKAEQETDCFSRYVHGLDASVKNLSNVVVDQAKKWQTLHKRDYERVGHSFNTFGQAFGMETQIGYSRDDIVDAIKSTGHAFNEIGKLCEEQPKQDWEPLGDVLHIYKGVLSAYPDIFNNHKNALLKRRETDKLISEGKMDQDQQKQVSQRVDTVSYSLLAEMNQFHADQSQELKRMFKIFLSKQIEFHENILHHLKEAEAKFQ